MGRSAADDTSILRAVSEAEDMVCQELVEVITTYLEGAMPAGERARFERHLDECPGCVVYVEQMRETVAALGRVRQDGLPPEVRQDLIRSFRDWRSAGPGPEG